MKFDQYVGLPYLCDGQDKNGLDCWGLVRLIYKEQLDIELPELTGIHINESLEVLRMVSAAMVSESRKWKEVTEPDIYDVVLMRRGVLPCHAGVYIGDGKLIHILEGTEVTIERIDSIPIAKRIVGFYRYA